MLRKELNLTDTLYVPIVEIYEKLQYKGILEFEIKEEHEMGDNEGLTFPDKNLIYLRVDVYDRAAAGSGRDRLTLAHELGHFLLHSKNEVSFARSKSSVKIYEDPEWQANCFGGEFLISKDLCKEMSEYAISQACGVTIKAAGVQKRAFNK